jgi:hypothetical protein
VREEKERERERERESERERERKTTRVLPGQVTAPRTCTHPPPESSAISK